MILSVRPLLLSAVLLFSSVVFAATPSDTLEALADWHAGRFPITLSGDGQWLLHADNEGLLQRRRVLPDKTLLNASLSLPDVAQTISTTHDGKQVAVLTATGCIGIARFDNPPSFAWLPGSQAKLQEDARTPSCGSTRAEKNWLGTRRYDESGAIALSGDGKLLALGGHPIRIVEAKSGKFVVSIPSGRTGAGYKLLHLRFLDHDRKLLMALVKDGHRDEAPALRSDVEFLVWDLQRKTLQNVHQTGTQGLNSCDIFWKYSEHSGKLWAIRTDGRYHLEPTAGETEWKPAPIKPYAINLKQCGAKPVAALNLPQNRDEILNRAGTISVPILWGAGSSQLSQNMTKRRGASVPCCVCAWPRQACNWHNGPWRFASRLSCPRPTAHNSSASRREARDPQQFSADTPLLWQLSTRLCWAAES
jgi:hypothetical protein